ncbi:MAG: hypothetical protein GDA40_10795 [Rhodobacteraceae bacterium]|nr:hypothetical protein [Paracoccaceae bacterium]
MLPLRQHYEDSIFDNLPRDTIFQGRIAHGMIIAGLISAVIGEQLQVTAQSIWASPEVSGPVRPDDQVYAEVKVTDIDMAKRRVKLDYHCAVDGKKVLIGEAMVLAPNRKFD